MQDNNFVTLSEAALLLKVHTKTLGRWVRNGKLPAMKIGKTVRISRQVIENLFNVKQ